ncbi:7TM GPCR protein [Aphelenchoides avenae]|nr:7TM GPCR protein [Aphelenchus avenae]
MRHKRDMYASAVPTFGVNNLSGDVDPAALQRDRATYEAFGSMYSMVSWMSFGMGLLLNAFLILLIRKRSVKEMKRYNIMLLQTCVLDIYALVVSAIVQPIYIMLEGSNVMLMNGPFRGVPQPWSFFLVEMWIFGYYFSVVSIVVQFVYRYLILCKGLTVSTRTYFTMVVIGGFLVLGYNGMLYFAMYNNRYRQLSDSLLADFHAFFDGGRAEPAVISMIGIPDTYKCLVICFYTFGMEFFCYATIIFCSISIKKSLDVAMSKAENERMNEINREVTTTLAIQATLPLVALVIGVFCILTCTSSKIIETYMSFYFISYLTIAVPTVPVLNPLITIMVIKPFRRTVFGGGKRHQ